MAEVFVSAAFFKSRLCHGGYQAAPASAAGPLFTALVLFASCFVMPLMSCLKKCKQLWALGQVQGVHSALHTAHTLRTQQLQRGSRGAATGAQAGTQAGAGERTSMVPDDAADYCPTDQRPLLIRDVCLPWHCMKAASCRGCSCCCFCSSSQSNENGAPFIL